MADNLTLPQWAANQTQPEVPVNDAAAQLSGALTDYLAVSMSGGSTSVSSTNFTQYMGFVASGGSSALNLTFPAVKRAIFYVVNGDTGSGALSVVVGSTSINLDSGITGYFSTDGTTNGLTLLASTLSVLDMGVSISGLPAASQNINLPINQSLKLPVSLAGSNFAIGTNPTGTMTFTLYKVVAGTPTNIGTVAFSTAGAPTVTFTAAVSFAPGNLLRISAPSSQDATGADVALGLRFLKV
jgi:hypothetical protein